MVKARPSAEKFGEGQGKLSVLVRCKVRNDAIRHTVVHYVDYILRMMGVAGWNDLALGYLYLKAPGGQS